MLDRITDLNYFTGMDGPIQITYLFSFKNGASKEFNLVFDRATLSFISQGAGAPPDWALLEKNRCTDCSIDENFHVYCPIALNLSGIVHEFRDFFAYENVGVTVLTSERTYTKNTIIQEGLGSLIGIIMVSSGCPVMEYLKPMARFHLPFASLTETIFRTTSVYLLSQYFLKQDGRQPAWDFGKIEDIYSGVGQLNRDFSLRLSEAAKKDASINALVNLDCFASMAPLAIDETLSELKQYFSAY